MLFSSVGTQSVCGVCFFCFGFKSIISNHCHAILCYFAIVVLFELPGRCLWRRAYGATKHWIVSCWLYVCWIPDLLCVYINTYAWNLAGHKCLGCVFAAVVSQRGLVLFTKKLKTKPNNRSVMETKTPEVRTTNSLSMRKCVLHLPLCFIWPDESASPVMRKQKGGRLCFNGSYHGGVFYFHLHIFYSVDQR